MEQVRRVASGIWAATKGQITQRTEPLNDWFLILHIELLHVHPVLDCLQRAADKTSG